MNQMFNFVNYENYEEIPFNEYVKVGMIDYDEYTASFSMSPSRLNHFMNNFEKHRFKYFLKLHVDYCPTNAYIYFRIYLGSNLLYSKGFSYSNSETIELDLTDYLIIRYAKN